MERASQLTDEQSAVVAANAFRTRVDAGAGTGKTSTLVQYARVRPRERGLYLAFNRSVRIEAKRRFPSNCQTSTFHGLAFNTHGRPFHSAGKLVPAVSPASVLHLVVDKDTTRRFIRVRLAMRVVHEFMVSAAARIEPSEQSLAEAASLGISQATLLTDAASIWSAMTDLSNRSVGITHDGYFKTYALDGAHQFSTPYGYILVDEAQDLNPVADQVLKAASCDICYVGDSAQAIYAFRGARDCLQTLAADVSLKLTKSFRFGPNIAALANRLLSKYAAQPLLLQGMSPQDLVGNVELDMPHAVICRTNAGAFDAAVEAVDGGHSIHFVGGPAAYGFSRIRQAYNLSVGDLSGVKDPFLRALGSLGLVKEYAELVKDAELRSICRVVDRHAGRIPGMLERIEQNCVTQPVGHSGSIESIFPAHCFISTCHKAKGLEFQQVRIAEDFPTFVKDGRPLKASEIDPQEVNLLYVAITRAAVILQPPPWLNQVLGLQPLPPRSVLTPEVPQPVAKPRPAASDTSTSLYRF